MLSIQAKKKFIKEHQEWSAEKLAEAIGDSASFVRTVLTVLEKDLACTHSYNRGGSVNWRDAKYEDFLFEHWPDNSQQELAELFEEEFDYSFSPNTLALHIPQSKRYGYERTSGAYPSYEWHRATDVDWSDPKYEKFLYENYPNVASFRELRELFRKAFDADFSKTTLRRRTPQSNSYGARGAYHHFEQNNQIIYECCGVEKKETENNTPHCPSCGKFMKPKIN